YVRALILVERDTHKEIVIGKNGAMLKKIGTLARQELETLLESKVFLECFVKVQKNWRDDVSIIQELGYSP
ncbi:MAG: KH domain-containing protein, partial [Candidatus Omnitrophica bacterium]|nr:KH domain-containing protein [Candidatus Omnitrophota bacterium]